MRIVLVDAKVRYINPTRSLVSTVLESFADTIAIGPGYVSGPTLREGLRAFLESVGDVDLVVATEHVLNAVNFDPHRVEAQYRRNYGAPPNRVDLIQLQNLREEIENGLGLPIVGALLETDFYSLKAADVARLNRQCDFFLAWGSEFFPLGEPRRQEVFSSKATSAWLSFTQQESSRIVSSGHFVSQSEVWGLPWNARPISASVLGADYAARRQARDSLRGIRGITAGGTALRGVGYALRPARVRAPAVGLASDWVQSNGFQALIAASKVSFTCGSALEYPLRKFFEIPAHGALMACDEPEALPTLGFVSGETHMAIDPKGLPDLVSRVKARPEWARNVALAGRRLVMERHSVSARSQQWAAAFSRISEGSFRGSQWENGEFILRSG